MVFIGNLGNWGKLIDLTRKPAVLVITPSSKLGSPISESHRQHSKDVMMSAARIHHVMWSFPAKFWPKNARNYFCT